MKPTPVFVELTAGTHYLSIRHENSIKIENLALSWIPPGEIFPRDIPANLMHPNVESTEAEQDYRATLRLIGILMVIVLPIVILVL